MSGYRFFGIGVLLSCAHTVPGLGMANMAMVIGVYGMILHASCKCMRWVLPIPGQLSPLKEILSSWPMPMFLLSGWMFSQWTLSRLVSHALAVNPVPVRSLALGLVLGYIWSQRHVLKSKRWIYMNLFLAWSMISYRATQVHLLEAMIEDMPTHVSGALFALFTIIPGLALDPHNLIWQYGPLHEGLTKSWQIILSGQYSIEMANAFYPILAFLGSMVSTGFIVVCLFHFLLRTRPQLMISILLGLMFGSLHLLWPFRLVDTYLHLGGQEILVVSDRAFLPDLMGMGWLWVLFWLILGFILSCIHGCMKSKK